MDKKSKSKDEYLYKLRLLLYPLISNNGEIEVKNLNGKDSIAYLFALIINSEFIKDKDKRNRIFCADDVVPLRVAIENERLKYWGKIYWLNKPIDHKCYLNYQDPFYATIEFSEVGFKVFNIFFGAIDKLDLDTNFWTKTEINWAYELNV